MPVLLWEPRSNMLVSYEPGKQVHTHNGVLTLPEGLCYGDTLISSTGFRYRALKPSASELSMKVRRTTTILYPKDMGYMIMETGLSAGSTVIEVGTGSGAMSLVIARIIGPTGKLHTFERRPEFLENAKKNLERWGLGENVEFHLRDPAAEGFGVQNADAAFVDVPEPWTMAQPAWDALAGGGFWVSLSPCVEQVQETYSALAKAGFVSLKTVELLEREFLVRTGKTRPRDRMVSHTGYITTARKVNKDHEKHSGSDNRQ